MNEGISILHISDLHRSKDFEITNKALLSSLISDQDRYMRYENPKIKSPEIIILSGDIIRGSAKETDSREELRSQYGEALEFLNALTSHFLKGDKDRLIIIPGNHDIDWSMSRESMQKIDSKIVMDDKNNLKWEILKESINQNSITRWSWKDLSFFTIIDEEKYKLRFQLFSEFYETFYESKRKYSLESNEQFEIFDIPEFNLTIAAFNSCFNNDHLRLIGDINSECIANVNIMLREFRRKGRLILGTWHHNTKGLPYDSNYMDSNHLKNLIESGISVGFHGHQHKTEVIHEYSDVVERKRIIVFSAGTLCGGPRELPTGNNRQYNIVELKEQKDNIEVTLHVREKTNSSHFGNPIWTAGRIDSKNVSHYSVEIEKPRIGDLTNSLVLIEEMMSVKKYDEAKYALRKMDLSNEFVRRFLAECILQTEDYELALSVLQEPNTEEEVIIILNAAIQLHDNGQSREILNRIDSKYLEAKSVMELVNKLNAIIR